MNCWIEVKKGKFNKILIFKLGVTCLLGVTCFA